MKSFMPAGGRIPTRTTNMKRLPKTIVITDLDGTLLDAATYSYAPALPVLDAIRIRGIPLILCSSKTRAEMEVLRRELGNHHPFVTENGGGIFIPEGYFAALADAEFYGGYRLIRLGTPYAEVRRRFVQLREELGAKVRGFGDMRDEEVAVLTGLTLPGAKHARERDFDEPFVFDGVADERFLQAIEAAGLVWTQGRLFHIMGMHDKGKAVGRLKSLYEKKLGRVTSIGLGDSLNDLPMLQAVDHPVLVRREDGSYDRRVAVPGLQRTNLPGPAGWNEAVHQLLSENSTGQLVEMFYAALAAVDPYGAVLRSAKMVDGRLQVGGAGYELAAFDRIIVVGAGKAAARMALAVEFLLGKRISAGLIVVKDGHTEPLAIIESVEGAHPVPNEAGEAGTKRLMELVHAADEKTLVVCLLSGGASALLVAPVEGVTLEDKQVVTRLLLKAGAAIDELNIVRKHLSAIKGGRLARIAYPAQVVALLLSDVIGDRIDVIASGPTAEDRSTFAEALEVMAKYRLVESIPQRVLDYLRKGAAGLAPETVKGDDVCLGHTQNVIIGSISLALHAAGEMARQLELPVRTVTAKLQGEARMAARFLAQTAREALLGLRPGESCCLLSGGETTVTVNGSGMGGRNQELALAFALEAEGLDSVSLLSAGTDGSDGPTDAAGALVDGKTASRARWLGIEPSRYLESNDSHSFFRRFDEISGGHSHFITGPTGTNVMDMQLLLLEKPEME